MIRWLRRLLRLDQPPRRYCCHCRHFGEWPSKFGICEYHGIVTKRDAIADQCEHFLKD